jgi:5-methylcytosine-specific restriction endonuclease McrA
MEHRAEAQRREGLTERQLAALALGRRKGTNNRTGYKHREESKRKASESHKVWCAANPDKVKARGEKTRGPNHYNWKGGCSRLNAAIRRMTENRVWMDAVKARDGKCAVCGTTENLEAHHIIPLAVLVDEYGIRNRDEARNCALLWDLANGQTLCGKHHYRVHGRQYDD